MRLLVWVQSYEVGGSEGETINSILSGHGKLKTIFRSLVFLLRCSGVCWHAKARVILLLLQSRGDRRVWRQFFSFVVDTMVQ